MAREDETAAVTVELAVEALEVAGVIAAAARTLSKAAFAEAAGLTMRTIEAPGLRTLPDLIEPDPLCAAETLPGVVSTSDFSAATNVRRGFADQNLILPDGLPVFKPWHLGGEVSFR